MSETTFHNVTITIEAETPRAAYDKLCALLHDDNYTVEYTTDVFTTDADPHHERSTTELWPTP